MHRTFFGPRHHRGAPLVVALALGALTVWGVALVTSADAAQGEHKVTICHATASRTNPYVEITVDEHSIVRAGHGGHEGPVFTPDLEGRWGDVIPAFDFGPGAQFPGLNVEDGQALLDAGCSLPAPTTSTSSTTTTTGPVG